MIDPLPEAEVLPGLSLTLGQQTQLGLWLETTAPGLRGDFTCQAPPGTESQGRGVGGQYGSCTFQHSL